MLHSDKTSGYSLIELLVVIAVIGLLAAVAAVSLGGVRDKARDTKRKNDLDQIGRFLAFGCLMPDSGAGEYDLNDLLLEMKNKYPQYANNIPANIRDPKTGTDAISNYKYIINDDNNCVLYANLENEKEDVTIPAISQPTPGGGKGIFEAPAAGWNGSRKYFQISN